MLALPRNVKRAAAFPKALFFLARFVSSLPVYSDPSYHAQSQSSLVVRGMGWLALFGAVSHLPLIIAGVSVMRVMPGAGWALILFAVPATCLLLMGGMGLMMRKGFGFYLVYAAILFGGIGGLGISLIPGLKALLKGKLDRES